MNPFLDLGLNYTVPDKTYAAQPQKIKDTSLSSLLDYLSDVQPYVKGEAYNMWREGGEPFLDLYDDTGQDFTPSFKLSSVPRKTLLDYVTSPDTMRIRRRNLGDFMAELAHAIQYNKSQSVRDSMDIENLRQKSVHGQDRYGIPGPNNTLFYPVFNEEYGKYNSIEEYIPGVTKESDVPIEFQAHEIIEPEINARFYKAIFGEELKK